MKRTGYIFLGTGVSVSAFFLVYAAFTGFDKIYILFHTISLVLFCLGTFLTFLQDPLEQRKRKANYVLLTGILMIGLAYFVLGRILNDAANAVFSIGVFVLAFAYLPLLTSIRIEKWKEYTEKKWMSAFLSVGDLLGLTCFILGALFRIMHWPWGNNLMITGIVLLTPLIVMWNRLLSRQLILRKQAEDKTRETLLKLKEKSKEVEDSIRYAKRLQEAILPPKEFIDKYIPAHFILYKPKDLVAGDFYWAEKFGDCFYIAAADSTGHGVPGALVSIVCSNALNRALKEFKETEPGKILDKTRELVLETFEKSASEVKDGMDISLLCIDLKTKKITWSGANNPLWYIHKGELTEVKGDKQPIGKTDFPKPFVTHDIGFKKETTFYLFTDGYADQFGGPKGKKFKYKQFSEFLMKIDQDEIGARSGLIEKTFEKWKTDLEQVDDVCVIGVRV